jgi:DNA-directed RNA polymerase specialized sigma24 family protein
MRDCQKCEVYQRTKGKGNQSCIICPTYKKYQVKSAPRQKIPIDILPDTIRDQIADSSAHMPDIIEAIQLLPDDLSAIISMRYISNLTQGSVASILRCQQSTIARREAAAMHSLKNILSHEIKELYVKK